MKAVPVLLMLLVAGVSTARAAEQEAPVPVSAPVPAATAKPASTVPAVESEAAKKWKSLKAQEEWVARLKKQIQGETNQLAEMRASLAEAFKLDLKKLEAGLYDYDEKSDTFTEKKPA